ncbi:hypothetical protein EON63_10295 [archaeon]|nr:MAG: hypothetical protein EON63_10295 [archaeon]
MLAMITNILCVCMQRLLHQEYGGYLCRPVRTCTHHQKVFAQDSQVWLTIMIDIYVIYSYHSPRHMPPSSSPYHLNNTHTIPYSTLDSHSLQLPLITVQWFMCLFVNTLRPTVALRVWDIFLNEGNKVRYVFMFCNIINYITTPYIIHHTSYIIRHTRSYSRCSSASLLRFLSCMRPSYVW